MPTMTLIVRPDGRATLTSREPLDADQVAALRAAIAGWDAETLLVLDPCEVVRITTLEVDLAAHEPVAV